MTTVGVAAVGAALMLTLPVAVPLDSPLINRDFDHGLAESTCPMPLLEVAWDSTGSVAPGLTDPHSRRPAVGWTYRILSGDTCPHGHVQWEEPGQLRVRVDPRDDGPGVATLAQALGQRGHLGLWYGAEEARLELVEVAGAPVEFTVLFSGVEPTPWPLVAGPPVTAEPGGARTLVIPLAYDGPMSGFLLAFRSAAAAEFTVTRVDLLGAEPRVLMAGN